MTASILRGTDQRRVDMNPLVYYLWGHLQTLVYSAPVENERDTSSTIFDVC